MKTVKIDTQIWTMKNLDVDCFKNGDIIKEVRNIKEWIACNKNKQPAWCYYDNDIRQSHGKLYNWYTVNDSRGLLNGWHVPTKEEFNIFKKTIAKNVELLSTKINDNKKTDSIFGYRHKDGHFYMTSNGDFLWSCSELHDINAHFSHINYNNNTISITNCGKNYGFNIRLIKD